MAEFEHVGHVGHESGGHSPGKKKFKLTKKNIVIFGGIGIAVFLLVSYVTRGRPAEEEEGDRITSEALEGDYVDGNPMNSSLVQAQLQNNQSLIEGSVDTALGNFANELGQNQESFKTDVIDTITDIGKENKEYADKVKKDVSKQLADQQKKYSSMESHLKDLENQLKKKPASTPAKKTTSTKSTSSKSSSPKYKTVTVKKGDTLSELTQRYGKGGTKKAYTETAKFNGIKNPDKIKAGQKIKILTK
ncbi:LysM peptidoglycan-binding domain-containing protein [Bacillus atrophaeus]|uniref:LysM peptidoglycan-binding domain-containing protein n=1 Tax=Bacillus atrophaeus TaxID=1452 RepID=UPI00227FDF98|nr:LysM domain-containing protein [Bacillus atrophaeus]MCY8915035.1 LysM peptidoglycan-binding domain-containing protein [Bacillus atrophaeus]MEC0927849.1 LysM domain-containing protein [Bacillus atrophaeus]